MSVSQVMQGVLKRASAVREKAHAIDQQHSRRAEQGARPSFEAFERAQERELQQHGGRGARIAQEVGEATSVPAEVNPSAPFPTGWAVGDTGAAVDARTGTAPATDGEAISNGRAAPTTPAPATPAPIAPAQTPPPSVPSVSSEVDTMAAKSPVTVASRVDAVAGGLQDAQLATSAEGGFAQHYGSFPVMVAGQLVELDLYTLGQKTAGTSDTVRRLYLTLNSTNLGPVRVTAESSENRLSVSVAGASQAAPEVLHEHVRAVGELATRLGWKFESVEQGTDLSGEPSDVDGLDRLL
jgi:hypothetical protein